MFGERAIVVMSAGLWLLTLACPCSHAIELRSDLLGLGQVRDGDQSRETETPVDLYGNLGLSRLRHGITLDTYFRLERDFARDDGASDFYQGSMHVPAAIRGVDMTLGRQFLSEGPGGTYVADAGKIRFDPGGPVVLSVFGGQPRYFEPTFSSPSLSQDEQIFGGSIRTTRWSAGTVGFNYLQQLRDGRTLRQLVSATGSTAFPRLPGLPTLYGAVAYDADRQNIDLANAGFSFLSFHGLSFNFESGYYKPQDQGERLITNVNRREDPIFELFSLSQLLQFRGGARYAVSRTLSVFGDYSYQRYEKLRGLFENGNVGGAGLLWLPGGDGLEVVRVEYYVADSGGGNVNGGRAVYENRVYDRILFRTQASLYGYDKANNQNYTTVSSLVGLGYLLYPGLVCEVNFEANHNKRFDEDFRFGFFVSYFLRARTGDTPPAQRPAPGERWQTPVGYRPQPWGPALSGPAPWRTESGGPES